jgi:CheY-like chemotaxis protein
MQSLFESRILVVDDSSVVREALVKYLSEKGYLHAECDSGGKAKSKIKKSNIDLLIQDVQRPSPNGLELYFWMKRNDRYANIPIILHTLSGARYFDERGFVQFGKRKFEGLYEIMLDEAIPPGIISVEIGRSAPSIYIESYVIKSDPEILIGEVSRVLETRLRWRDPIKEYKRRNEYLWPAVSYRA